MITVDRSWEKFFEQNRREEYFQTLIQLLKKEVESGYTIFPSERNIFSAFRETSLDDVRVVILGQDPYHGTDQADGLCFSVTNQNRLPPSLKNILRELADDLSIDSFKSSGSLVSWARQGVLLLNTILTVRKDSPMSHRGIGWEIFVDRVLMLIWQLNRPLSFILWGRAASDLMKTKECIFVNNPRQLIRSAHPSPLSAHNGFWNSKPFSRANDFLKSQNSNVIEWESVFDKKTP